MSERLSVADARSEYQEAVATYWQTLKAAQLAARDAEWRAAVERLKADHLTVHRNPLSVLDEILAAMEVPHDGQ